MAKETAHQLGTPLSSINGWIEILKDDHSKLSQALSEIEVDAKRLNKIALRFSQIGSHPSLKPVEIIPVLENIILYFRKRLPHLKKKIAIVLKNESNPVLEINIELFEWVIENMIKNAIDAIETNDGKIAIHVLPDTHGEGFFIDITDNGKGIASSNQKDVFKPGFSTKKRGWGLGLSLAKRIIEDYHGGKLFIRESRLDGGSTFRIALKGNTQ